MATIKITDGNVLGLAPGEYEQTTDANGTIHIKPAKAKAGHGYNILENGDVYFTPLSDESITPQHWRYDYYDRRDASIGRVFLTKEAAVNYKENPESAEYETLRAKMFAAYHECLAAHGLSEWRWKFGEKFYAVRENCVLDILRGNGYDVCNPFKFPHATIIGELACNDFIARVKHDWQRWCELSTGR